MDDLNTLTVGGLKGDFAISTLHQHGIHSILEYPRYADVVNAALRNDIDCFIMAKASADYLLRKNNAMNQFRFYGPIQQGIMHRAVKCGNENILETVETGNAKILPSEYADIERRWLSETMGFTNKMKMVLIVPSIACIVILTLGAVSAQEDSSADVLDIAPESSSAKTRVGVNGNRQCHARPSPYLYRRRHNNRP